MKFSLCHILVIACACVALQISSSQPIDSSQDSYTTELLSETTDSYTTELSSETTDSPNFDSENESPDSETPESQKLIPQNEFTNTASESTTFRNEIMNDLPEEESSPKISHRTSYFVAPTYNSMENLLQDDIRKGLLKYYNKDETLPNVTENELLDDNEDEDRLPLKMVLLAMESSEVLRRTTRAVGFMERQMVEIILLSKSAVRQVLNCVVTPENSCGIPGKFEDMLKREGATILLSGKCSPGTCAPSTEAMAQKFLERASQRYPDMYSEAYDKLWLKRTKEQEKLIETRLAADTTLYVDQQRQFLEQEQQQQQQLEAEKEQNSGSYWTNWW